jgi:hypothetical protein
VRSSVNPKGSKKNVGENMGVEVAKKYDQMEDMYKIFKEDSS